MGVPEGEQPSDQGGVGPGLGGAQHEAGGPASIPWAHLPCVPDSHIALKVNITKCYFTDNKTDPVGK